MNTWPRLQPRLRFRARRPGRRGKLTLLLGCTVLLAACTADGNLALEVPAEGTAGGDAANNGGIVTVGTIQLLGLLTVLALAPAFLIMVTSFTRIIVVLSLLRNAIGVPQLPPNQVMLGLGLFLSFFVMAPTFQTINETALQPYLNGEITQGEAFDLGQKPLRAFMLEQTREQDLGLFVKLARMEQPRSADDVPTHVLIPAFIISELKTAFQMGFIVFVPFLVIDLVVSSALLSMGMMMLPPVLISLPFKVLLFVLVDGWYLIVGSLVGSFAT